MGERVSPRLILASASPRRRELLEAAGFTVAVRPSHLDESLRPGESPGAAVLRLARAKAAAIAAAPGLPPDAVVLGADTEVVLDGCALGKPAGEAEARAMLRRLAGRAHDVLTGFCLRRGPREVSGVEATRVWITALSDAEIAAYAASGEPLDKAGGYAIQGLAARFIPRIEGSYANVVGLPVAAVWRAWRSLTG